MACLNNFKIPLINILIASILGLLLRYMPLEYIDGVNYKFFLHAHSHVAFLGWVYLGLFILLINIYLKNLPQLHKKYKVQFWLTQLSVVGMLVTFPFQGYGLYSISFSTLHIFLSYWFVLSFWKDLNMNPEIRNQFGRSLLFIKAGLIFLMLSSLGTWTVGAVMAKGMNDHPLYNLSVYFYLHFQYNGWFTFAVIGIFLALLERAGYQLEKKNSMLFFILMLASTIFAYLFSTLYLKPNDSIYAMAFSAALIQIIAVSFFLTIIREADLNVVFGKTNANILKLVFGLYMVKLLLQLLSSFLPMFEIRPFIIGYLHLILIGFVTLFLLVAATHLKIMVRPKYYMHGIKVLIAGFILSESLIFLAGIFVWAGIDNSEKFTLFLFFASILMPVGFIIISISQFRSKVNVVLKPKGKMHSLG